MSEFKGTPHNSAVPGDIAEIVLMPGDPLRAKLIAETYLDHAVCYNTVRNVLGYTGEYKGRRISVQASGMGIPSMGIYSYELYNFYGVKKILRIGSAGAISDELELGDVVIASGVCTDSNYISQYKLPGTFTPGADWDMCQAVIQSCKDRRQKYKAGTVLVSDVFYNEDPADLEVWKKMGVLCVEMESVSLYCNALRSGNKALSMFTISDLPLKGVSLEADARRTGFTNMIETALEACLHFEE